MSKILLLGGSGKVGSYLKRLLNKIGHTTALSHQGLDLLNSYDCWNYITWLKPEYIVNLAAVTTTIKLNKEKPADIHYQTLQMNLNLLKGIVNATYIPKKIINIVSSCAYGEQEILSEEEFLLGNVNASVRPHGEAKKQVYLMSQFYKQQYNLPITCICFNSICGNEKWNNPSTLKVLPALVKKIVDARKNNESSTVVWGSGKARREFIHYTDAALGIIRVLKKYDGDLINLGTGKDISIREMCDCISREVGYEGEILFDKTYPDGQLTKLLKVDRMQQQLKWSPVIETLQMIKLLKKEYKSYYEGISHRS